MEKLTRTLGENIPMELVQTPATTTFISVPTHKHSYSETNAPTVQAGPSSLPVRVAKAAQAVTAVALHNAANLSGNRRPMKNGRSEEPLASPRPFVLQPAPRSRAFLKPRSDVGPRCPSSVAWGKRREREWSGEWNVMDIQVVVQGLRALKV